MTTDKDRQPRRVDRVVIASVVAVGIGVTWWLWPGSDALTTVGPTLEAVSATANPAMGTSSGASGFTRTTPLAPAGAHPTHPDRPAVPAGDGTSPGHPPGTTPAVTSTSRRPSSAAPTNTTQGTDQHAATPATITVPFASESHPNGVKMTVIPHGPASDGSMWIPGPEEGIDDWANDVAWLNTPGFAAPFSTHGAVIIVGHINFNGIPGALADLAEYGTADIGKNIIVTMTDGRTRAYRITRGFTIAKDELAAEPNQGPLHTAIFGQTQSYGPPGQQTEELRLISCGGPYDPATRNYSSNVIITAQPMS